jgi:CheY-like chemotaxis protein
MPRILLVEDNEMNRDMLSRRLGRRGFEVRIATDGRAGVELAAAEPFDVILMDLSLPELDGWEATRRIRQTPRNEAVPIIALTAHAMAGDRDRAIEAGADDYDTKPVDLDRLLGKIDLALSRRRPAVATRQLTADEIGELRHELRTPLNLIIGYSEMLLEDMDPATGARRDAVAEILAAGRSVLELVNTRLSPALTSIGTPELAALAEAIREPQSTIVATAERALADARSAGQGDSQFSKDVEKIGRAAVRLLDVAQAPAEAAKGDASRTSAAAVPTPVPVAAADVAAAEPARILIVDDLEDNRSVLERRLARQGHHVVCASGGLQALDFMAHDTFDLVLLDVMMPDLDGLAVLERLKASPKFRDVPVIMISALDDVATVVRCIERGAEDHLPKPFDPVLLGARINASLERKRLRDAELEYLKHVGHVIDAATAVEAGSYETSSLADVAKRTDELGRLARVFDAMVAQVRTREDRLRDQLGALRREIEAANATAAANAPERLPHALPTGELFANRYEILEQTGSGGMGIVYRAYDRDLAEQVAIKTLRTEFTSDADAIGRFKQELRLARHISHRNVVRLHDIGECDGIYYLTMEFVNGITVRELLRTRSQLGVSATLAIARQLGDSLVVAHEQGVIHRDIKPENLLLDSDGVLKVMDFGVARLAEGVSSITTAGAVVGTPAYMAPEQLLSEEVDLRSDLYALGVVLYECLTGKRPFDASSPFVLIAHVLKDSPKPPASMQSGIPAALNDLILSLLAKEPGQRPASAADVVTRLARIA